MSGHEWKPGDVAMVTLPDGTESRGMRNRTNDGWDHIGSFADGCCFDFIGHSDARPLVVIDPEDREQVERLARVYVGRWAPTEGHIDVVLPDLQAALRSLVEPPKPPEPTGVGAVVEDVDGRTHVRVRNIENEWAGQDGLWRVWRNIAAVKVLSPGVSDA